MPRFINYRKQKIIKFIWVASLELSKKYPYDFYSEKICKQNRVIII